MISLEQLEEMFTNIAAGPKWNMAGPMLWGYFFTDPSQQLLETAAEELQTQGYRTVAIFGAEVDKDEDPYLFLHVEREESHSPASLHRRNAEFYALAERLGLRSYDGMDVGPVVN